MRAAIKAKADVLLTGDKDFLESGVELPCDKLRRLIGFSFRKHPRYNWSGQRIRVIEELIAYQVRELLGE